MIFLSKLKRLWYQVFQITGPNRQIDFFHRNVPLTFTKSLVYLGLALSTRLSPFPQIERNMINVRKNIVALNKTTPIRKFNFESAPRLPKSVFHPIGFYGLDCLNVISDDKLSDQSYKIHGIFYKYWASLPIYTSNHHLTDLIEISDPVSIKTAPIGARKLAYYTQMLFTTSYAVPPNVFVSPNPQKERVTPLHAHANCVVTTYHRFIPPHVQLPPPQTPPSGKN